MEENKKTPNAVEIATRIRKYIRQNNLGENSKLPSENKLAEMFHVDRNVIRAAYAHLRSQGDVYSVKGKGYFPIKKTRPLIYQHRSDIGFSEIFSKNRSEYENVLVSWRLSPVTEAEANRLHLPVGEPVYRLKTIRRMDGKVFAVCYSTLPQKFVPDMEQYFDEYKSVNEILMEKYGYSHPVCDSISIVAAVPSVDDIKYMQMAEHIPILSISCCFSTPQTGLLEHFVIHARSDMFAFNMNFKQEEN